MAKVFFSYSHKDKAIREKIDQHFSVLKRSTAIETWYDNEIPAGDNFDNSIKIELEEADIILLLVSANFLASDYCHDIELKLALEKHNNGEAKAVPIIVDICDWENTPLKKLKAIPTDGKAIRKFGNRSEAYQNITDEIRRLAKTINAPTHKILKAGASNKNAKIRSATSTSFKVARFIKKYYKSLSILGILIFVIAALPSKQEQAEYDAFNKPTIVHDFNADGYLDKVSYLGNEYNKEQQGLYIFLYDKNTENYIPPFHKSHDIWNNRDDLEYVELARNENTLIINFYAFMSSELDYQIQISARNMDLIVDNYKRYKNNFLACNIDYLLGHSLINGLTTTFTPYEYPLNEWNTTSLATECQ